MLLTFLLALVLVVPAAAQQMTLYSCRTPGGSTVGTAGWVADVGGTMRNECARPAGGGLLAQAGTNTVRAGWMFTAAPNTTIASFDANVCMHSGPFGFTWFYKGDESLLTELKTTTANQSVGCQTPTMLRGETGRITRVAFNALCLGQCDASVELHTFKATVSDPFSPVVSSVRGSLATSVTQDGAETVTFDARDLGVGVFRAVAYVRPDAAGKWEEVKTMPDGVCTPVRETNELHEFAAPQPCPLARDAIALTLQPGMLAVGEHQLKVVVEDAAGNEATVLAPRTYTVPAPPLTTFAASAPPAEETVSTPLPRESAPARAAPALPPSFARLSITTPRAHPLPTAGAFRLTGRLLDKDGNPIARARVSLSTRGYMPKSRSSVGSWTALGIAETDASGEFRARIPPGASRSVLVSYADVSAQADFSVAAQIRVRALSTRVRNGRSAVIRGRVVGPIPDGGLPVALEVRDGARWLPVPTTRRWVKTTRTGRFALAYRFRRTFQRSTYRFRVVADEDSAFEYTRGASRTVDIHVRP